VDRFENAARSSGVAEIQWCFIARAPEQRMRPQHLPALV